MAEPLASSPTSLLASLPSSSLPNSPFGHQKLAAWGHGDRLNGLSIPSRAKPKGWKFNAVCEELWDTFTLGSDVCLSIVHPGTTAFASRALLGPGHPACGHGTRLSWVCPRVPDSTFARGGQGMAPGMSPPPYSTSQRPRGKGNSSPFLPHGGVRSLRTPRWDPAFPSPTLNRRSKVGFGPSGSARGAGEDPITTRWQCSPGHAPLAHPGFIRVPINRRFPRVSPKNPSTAVWAARLCQGRGRCPGPHQGWRKHTKEQETEQFRGQEVCVDSHFGAPSCRRLLPLPAPWGIWFLQVPSVL